MGLELGFFESLQTQLDQNRKFSFPFLISNIFVYFYVVHQNKFLASSSVFESKVNNGFGIKFRIRMGIPFERAFGFHIRSFSFHGRLYQVQCHLLRLAANCL